MLETREQLCRLWLSLCEGVSAKARALLIVRFGGFETLFDAFPRDCADILSSRAMEDLSSLKAAGLDKIALRLEQLGISIAFLGDERDYPSLLTSITEPPDLLFFKGRLTGQEERSIAIVGSRRETRYGRNQAHAIARDLAAKGVVIISGLARGIDTAAHLGALEAGGRTIAVLGSGLSNIYPIENKELAERILQGGGAIISELPPASEPLAYHFPVRNRIVSGLSHGLLLVEAREKSGTLITMGHALEQGREVFALPGEVDAPGSLIPHQMIREGARLCTCAQDIMEDMGWQSPQPSQTEQIRLRFEELSGVQGLIADSLQDEQKSFDELQAATGLSTSDLNTHITLMEMDGIIESLPGRLFKLCRVFGSAVMHPK